MIEDCLKQLSSTDRRALMQAFNCHGSLIIKLANNRFMGVNIIPNSKLKIIASQGVWTLGEYK